MKAITLEELKKTPDGTLVNEAINFINDSIIVKKWHNNYKDDKYLIKNYYAIIISPYQRFNENTLIAALAHFSKNGWDCKYGDCYDARGPHSCVYFNKKHFNSDLTKIK